jgi:hypothetical protein
MYKKCLSVDACWRRFDDAKIIHAPIRRRQLAIAAAPAAMCPLFSRLSNWDLCNTEILEFFTPI